MSLIDSPRGQFDRVVSLAEERARRCLAAPRAVFRIGDSVEWLTSGGCRVEGRVIGLCDIRGEASAVIFAAGWATQIVALHRLAHANPHPAA